MITKTVVANRSAFFSSKDMNRKFRCRWKKSIATTRAAAKISGFRTMLRQRQATRKSRRMLAQKRSWTGRRSHTRVSIIASYGVPEGGKVLFGIGKSSIIAGKSPEAANSILRFTHLHILFIISVVSYLYEKISINHFDGFFVCCPPCLSTL